ncbi:hypothetical protein [Lentzea sp. NBRC 102530]|uniref:hypothetical protein n=1 Tax=Lentzea sp. NBRC 102530 TaxID=3032201 RepID=UPI0024A3CB55|nr:hypothetical protein [Lentzea sp. NBRC 102530]GLY54886.1 hypothetical protein Lesp01_85410 [Lentzea sp. NBRC 102530]
MTSRFGEKITNAEAYDTARGAAKEMSDELLAKVAADKSNGPNQAKAAADEQAARQATT